jgi:hypothetical protein
VAGLLALMLLTDARRPARTRADGTLVPLAEQDRTRWDATLIAEGIALITETLPKGPVGPYQVQAAINVVHDEAPDATDWPQILALYGVLARLSDNSMVTLPAGTPLPHAPRRPTVNSANDDLVQHPPSRRDPLFRVRPSRVLKGPLMSAEAENGTPDWWRPTYFGRPAANEAMTTVAAPLFAGFSVTLIGVIAQDTDRFLLPGIAMCLLSFASIFFMIALQSGFQARLYLASPADIADWHPEYQGAPEKLAAEMSMQNRASKGFIAWEARSARYYSFGLVSMLLGLAATVAPPAGTSQSAFRWIGVGAILLMFLLELVWSFAPKWWLGHPDLARRMKLEPVLNAWFRPARRIDEKAQKKAQREVNRT